MFSTQQARSEEAVQRAQLLIDERLADGTSVDQLAQAAGVSTRTLMRRFRRATGDGPREYIQRVRVEAAKRALEHSEQSSVSIAESVGYGDLVAFRKLFVRMIGSTRPWTTARATVRGTRRRGWWRRRVAGLARGPVEGAGGFGRTPTGRPMKELLDRLYRQNGGWRRSPRGSSFASRSSSRLRGSRGTCSRRPRRSCLKTLRPLSSLTSELEASTARWWNRGLLPGGAMMTTFFRILDVAVGFTFQARQVMDTVIDNLARAIRKLAAVGIEYAVVSADHGHLFFASDRDESMRTDAPGGNTVELHRRCWIGRGGATSAGCVRVPASSLGYASDLEFVFPAATAVFRAGGDLAFHHGGPSLQELVIPVVTVRTKVRESVPPSAGPIEATGLPDAVTNRIFSVTFTYGPKQMLLGAAGIQVRPLLMAAGKEVGSVGMAVDAQFDRATGTVNLEPNKPVTIAFLLRASPENVWIIC
jgi:AraC-like DNA-binding protein